MNEKNIMSFNNFLIESDKNVFDNINEKYENEIVQIVENFVTDIEFDFTELNESEKLESADLFSIVETIIINPIDEKFLESIVKDMSVYEEINEGARDAVGEDPNNNNKKKSLLNKVKAVANALWEKLKEWANAVKKKIGQVRDPNKRKAMVKKFKKDYADRKKAIIKKINASKKGIQDKLSNLKDFFKKINKK